MAPNPFEVYVDDPTIEDDERLLRLLPPGQTKFDGDVAVRPQTNAFNDYPVDRLHEVRAPAVAVSVFLESVMQANGTSAQDLLARWDPSLTYGVAAITAGAARREAQGVVRWPRPDFPEHAMVFCLDRPKKSDGQSKRLARSAEILITPRRP